MPDDLKPAGETPATGATPSGGTPPAGGAKPSVEEMTAQLATLSKKLEEVTTESIGRRKELQELKPLRSVIDGLRSALGVEGDPSAIEAKVKEITTQSQSRMKSLLLRSEVTAAAVKAGMRDPSDATRLLDLSSVQVDLDKETVDAKALAEQMASLKTSKPYLFADAPAPAGGIPKPPAGTQDPGAPSAGLNGSVLEAWTAATTSGNRQAMAELIAKHGAEIGKHIDSLKGRN